MSRIGSLVKGFRKLVGVGLTLLLIGFALEALTIALRRWVSFPVWLNDGTRIALTLPCIVTCVAGMIWFNRTLNLARIHLAGGENRLVTHGPFSYVRHPLYATLLLTLPPLFVIWYADLIFLVPWAGAIGVAHLVVRLEERGLVEAFGADYQRYREQVPALLPIRGCAGRRYRERRG